MTPDDPIDVVTPIDGVYDKPSTVDDQIRWLAAVGLHARVVWADQDLAVIVADSPSDTPLLETIDDARRRLPPD